MSAFRRRWRNDVKGFFESLLFSSGKIRTREETNEQENHRVNVIVCHLWQFIERKRENATIKSYDKMRKMINKREIIPLAMIIIIQKRQEEKVSREERIDTKMIRHSKEFAHVINLDGILKYLPLKLDKAHTR